MINKLIIILCKQLKDQDKKLNNKWNNNRNIKYKK